MSSSTTTVPGSDGGKITRRRLGRASGPPGVIVTEIQAFAAALVIARRGNVDAVAQRLSKLVDAPVADASRRVGTADLSVTGVAPGQWFVLAERMRAAGLLDLLSGGLAGLASVSEQGDGRCILHIGGPDARAALAKGIPIDIAPQVFKVGDAAQTAAAHIGLGIALVDAAPRFELVTALSTRASFLAWLLPAAAEFGVDVA